MKSLVFTLLSAAWALTPVVASAATTRPALAAGPVEKDGLQVTLTGEKAVFARNEPIRFALLFRNVSDGPVSLSDAGDFENWLIRLEEVPGGMPWRLQSVAAEAPKADHPPRELGPGESREIPTEWGSNRFPFRYESELVLNLPMPPVDGLRPGRYRLWVGISLAKRPGPDSPQPGFRGDLNLGPVEIEIADRDDPAGPQAGEPVKENSAEFQTVTRALWPVPRAGGKSEVLLGLKVTNRGGTWMQINLYDTVRVALVDSRGVELQCVSVRERTFIPEPLVLTSREGRTVYRNATLEWSSDGKSLRLTGTDGAGGSWHFDGLRPGRYKVHFACENNDDLLKPVLSRPAKHAIDPKEAPFWTGKVTTRDVDVEIAEAPAQAGTAPEGKGAGALESFKGWELYVWRDGADTLYSLLPGTNENKTADQVRRAAVRGVEAIKPKLHALKAGQHVGILGARRGEPPPQAAADEVAGYCRKIGLDAQ